MQNAIIPMCTSITVNAVHIVCSLWFALGMDMGIVGIAYASIVAQYSGLTLAVVLLLWRYRANLHVSTGVWRWIWSRCAASSG